MTLPELVQAFVQAVDTLAVHLERDLELQVGYFIGDHQLEDATAMFLYCAQVDTWAKEAVEPTDQHVGIQRAVDKANGSTHANGAAGVRCHWCASVLNKRFKTPFRDGIWNRRQVSVGDRGVLPTRPKNQWGYALLAHTLGKMRLCVTGKHSNTEIRTVELKKYNYTAKLFPVARTSHIVSPR